LAQWIAAALLLMSSVAPAYALLGSGNYVATGPTAHARTGPTLTLLQNGKVLIAGQGTADLYDPATGTWSATGNPVVSRQYPTATLLPNGKVLVAGGIGSTGTVLNSTELYDPATGTWSASGAMSSPRYVATANLLANGKVLIAGGTSTPDESSALNSADLYDPATGIVTPTGSFVGNRFFASSVLLDNGMVLLTGGANTSGTPIATSNLYNPATGTWAPTGAMATNRVYAPVVKLPSGKVLAAGGLTSGSSFSAEVYDPATGVWATANNMVTGVSQHSMVLLSNGQVLAVGDTQLASQIYDPVTNIWRPSGFPLTPHDSVQTATALLLRNGDVLLGPAEGGVAAELYRSAVPRTKIDFNGDVKSDIVFENGIGTRWLYNMNGGAVQTSSALPGASPGWVLAGMGDFDGNGTTDMLWRNTADATQYWIYLMNGPTIIGGGLVAVAPGYRPTYIADFNADLKSDIVWENNAGGRWFYFMNGASVTSSAPVPTAVAGWEIAGVGDFNGDNRADLLWVNTAVPTQYWIYLLDGAQIIGSGGLNVAPGYQQTWIGDVNRDGKADIIWENGTNSRWVYTLNGTALIASFALPPASPGWQIVGVGDYDNLSGLDLLWQNTANPTQYWIYLLSTTGAIVGGAGLNVAPGYLPLTH
jgi:hypothetical protein